MTESANPQETERRRALRLRTLLSGIALFDDRTSTMDCTIRSLSAYGARVELAEAYRLPQAFDLSIPHHQQVHRAEVIWRRGECAGLALSDVKPREAPARRHMTPRQMRRAHEKEMAEALY